MPKSRSLIAALLVLPAVLLTYSNHFHNSFQFDDDHTIVNNVYIRTLANVPRFFTDATTSSVNPANQSWRPLVTASLALDYRLGKGYNAFYFHLSTFLWYLLLLVCLGLLFQSILDRVEPDPRNVWAAWFAAAWFGLHPAMAETVNYIIQRADLLSTLGVVAGLAIYIRLPQRRRTGLYLLPVAIGLLCKAPALIFPALLAAYLLLFEESSWGRVLRLSVPALALTIAFLVLQSLFTPKTFVAGASSAYRYLLTQPYVWFRYFVSFFLPLHLSADSDLGPLDSFLSLEAIGGFLFAALLLCTIYLTAKNPKSKPVAFGLVWFVLGLIPTSVFPLAEVENDHRMFLPFIGLALATVWTGACILRSQAERRDVQAVLVTAAVCLLLLYAAWTRRRNQVWHTEASLWEDVTLKSPRNGRGLMNFGLTRMSAGDFPGALLYFERAVQYSPNYPELEINLAIANGGLRRTTEAEQHFRRAIQLAPGLADSHFFYARWLAGEGRREQAIAELRTAVAVNPARLDARLLLLQRYAEQGAWTDLKSLAQETLTLAPDDPTVRAFASMQPGQAAAVAPQPGSAVTPETLINLSLEAFQKQDFEGCIRLAQVALQMRPDYADAYNNIMAAYNSLGRWDEAIEAGKQALRIKPDYQLARNNLAWAESQKNLPRNGKH